MLFLLVVSSPALGLSFSSGPVVSPDNATTTVSFTCQFTPLGTGTLSADITWYRDGTNYAGADQSTSVSDGVPFESNPVPTVATSKGQDWRCQVTLDNVTASLATNSSDVTVENSLPVVTYPASLVTVYENALHNITATAFDADADSISSWFSVDNNESDYGGALFTISSNGDISFTPADESVAGNHTMTLFARDSGYGQGWGGTDIVYQVIAVNDSPIIDTGTLQQTCTEGTLCEFIVSALDEEGDDLSFAANESFINMDALGFASFTPDFYDTGNWSINITVDDSLTQSWGILNLTIETINHPPTFTYNSSLTSYGSQNNASFTFVVNATDSDATDTINFSVITNCSYPNPWNVTIVSNGAGSTNASANITMALNVTENNSFVACRDVIIVATDFESGSPKESVNFSVTFNIANENDPPIIYEISNYSINGNEVNMSSILSAKGLTFQFQVNGTDPDNLTYEGDSWNYSLSGHNPAWFQIDDVSGLVSSTVLMNDSYIGNHSFFVVITDVNGSSYNRSMNITVMNNSAPVFRPLDNSSCMENVLCTKLFIADDNENNLVNYSFFSMTYTRPRWNGTHVVYFDADKVTFNETYILSNYINYSSYNSSTINYTFSITPDDADVGRYEINITYRDYFGLDTTKTTLFNVTNVNDNPQLDNDNDSLSVDALEFSNFVEGVLFNKTIYAIDGDVLYGLDNLTFNYSLQSANISNMTLIKTSSSSALLSFLPNSSHIGNHTINITVTDSLSNSDTQTINFTVYPPSLPPVINQIRPYENGGVTFTSFTATIPANNITYVVGTENESLLFDIAATDPTNDDMTISWYENGTLLSSSSYSGPGASFYNPTFDFFDEGQKNITAVIQDEFYSESSFTWMVEIANTNRPPYKDNDLVDLSAAQSRSVSGRQTFTDFFRQTASGYTVLLDPDDDVGGDGYLNSSESNTMTFYLNTSGTCDELATFIFSGNSLTINPGQVGTCYTNFIGGDGEFNVSSNIIQVDILELEDENSNENRGSTSVEYEQITVPFEFEVDSPTAFQFIIPGITTIYENGTVVIPLRLKNTWDTEIRDIEVKANTSAPNLTWSFSQDIFDAMAVSQVENINLTFTNYRHDAPFEVNISGYIGSLDYTSSVTVYINALERGREDSASLKSRIGFARDLLSDNPECQELNELLDAAESSLDTNDKTALELLNGVINGCKYLVDKSKTAVNPQPETFLGKLGVYTGSSIDFNKLLGVLMILFFAAIIVGVITRSTMKRI